MLMLRLVSHGRRVRSRGSVRESAPRCLGRNALAAAAAQQRAGANLVPLDACSCLLKQRRELTFDLPDSRDDKFSTETLFSSTGDLC